VDWKPQVSYGWWPSHRVNTKQTLVGVPGVLNRGEGEKDPHHGDNAPQHFHPAFEVDDNANYDEVRNRVITEIQSFAHGFQGSWNWRLGWGKNCHTFQQRLKTAVGLHNKETYYWLRQPEDGQDTSSVLNEKREQRLRAAINRLVYDDIGEDLFSQEAADRILKTDLKISNRGDWDGLSAEVKTALAQKLGVSMESLQNKAEAAFPE
jgi:hypothetical protein